MWRGYTGIAAYSYVHRFVKHQKIQQQQRNSYQWSGRILALLNMYGDSTIEIIQKA
jgi:hypothetical protein